MGDVPPQIFHIAIPSDWEAALAEGQYVMSTRGVTLAEEGYIHCSFPEQVVATANRYYGDLERLLVLTVDTERVPSEIVVELPHPDAPEPYPHVYGPIPVSAVVGVELWQR